MTLPNVTLFPQARMRLHIFEPRYRQMLEEVLQSRRMITIAMRKPGSSREIPFTVAGLGLVRVCLEQPDGTSILILEGLSRVELLNTVRRVPFRINRIRPLPTPNRDSVTIDALMAKVRDLVSERIKQGLKTRPNAPKSHSIKEIIAYLDKLSDPDQVADLVSCALLPGPVERQTILETVEIEPRLKHLIHFLMAEITQNRKK